MFRVYNLSMASVYLPFGYPKISGQQYANVIYQGTMVRLYQVPTDPRTDAQLEERRFFSDLARMRGTLGDWGKGALRLALGSRWVGNFLQVVKADDDGYYAGLAAEWDGFTPNARADWQAAAPYQATFNNQGLSFFSISRMVYHILSLYSPVLFECQEWGESDSALALAWWSLTKNDAIVKNLYDVEPPNFTIGQSWTRVEQEGAAGGHVWQADHENPTAITFYSTRKIVKVFFVWTAPGDTWRWRCNGGEWQTFTVGYYAYGYVGGATDNGLYFLEIEPVSYDVKIDSVEGL
jgi:hypothetical protein